MTNAYQPDITARLDDIDKRLEQLGDELPTIQNGMRRKGANNQQI
jgi:hypothetical protein